MTVGAILGALAVVAVLVIVLLLVWRPGAAPADPDAQPSGAAAVEDEADPGFGDDGTPEGAAEADDAGAEPLDAAGEDEAAAADAGDEAAGADDTPDVEDVAGAEGDAPDDIAQGADEAPPGEEDEAAAADGEGAPADEAAPAEGEGAPAEGEEVPAEDEQAPADAGDAPADGDGAAADGESPGAADAEGAAPPEADATVDVEGEAEPAIRTDPTQRVAEVGETARSTHEAVTNAIEETESRLENLEQATPDAEPPTFDLPTPEGDDGARVRDAGVEAGATRDRLQSVASNARSATRATVEETPAQVEVSGPASAQEDGPRVRTAEVSSNVPRERLQSASSTLEDATRTTVEATDARVEVSTAGDAEAGTARIRTATVGGAGAAAPPLPDPSATRSTGPADGEGANVSLASDAEERPAARLLDPTVPTLQDEIRELAREARESLDVTTASPTEPTR